MRAWKNLTLISLALFSSATLAQASGSLFDKALHSKHWFVNFSAAYIWPSLGKSKTTVPNGSSAPSPYNVDTYSVKDPEATFGGLIGLGYRWDTQHKLLPHYSLAARYEYMSRFNVKGTVDQYSAPGFVNYSYRMYGASNLFSLLGKIDLYDFHSLDPYLSLGLGLANTKINSYKETPYSGIIARVSPAYEGHTNSQFTYSLGLGLDYFATQKLAISLGYEYADLGSVKSGNGVSTWSDTSLSFGRLSTSSILLSLSYQF